MAYALLLDLDTSENKEFDLFEIFCCSFDAKVIYLHTGN